jgi:hypothetical protein
MWNDLHDFRDWSHSETAYSFAVGKERHGWTCEIACSRDWLAQVSQCAVRYVHCSDGQVVEDAYTRSLLTRNEMLTAYYAAGLDLVKEYGDASLGPLTGTSRLVVHVLRTRQQA